MTRTSSASSGFERPAAVTALPPGTPPLVEVGSPTSVLKAFFCSPLPSNSPCIIGNMTANMPVARLHAGDDRLERQRLGKPVAGGEVFQREHHRLDVVGRGEELPHQQAGTSVRRCAASCPAAAPARSAPRTCRRRRPAGRAGTVALPNGGGPFCDTMMETQRAEPARAAQPKRVGAVDRARQVEPLRVVAAHLAVRVERRPQVRAGAVFVLQGAQRDERGHARQVPQALGEIDLVVGQRLGQRLAAGGLQRPAELPPGVGRGSVAGPSP